MANRERLAIQRNFAAPSREVGHFRHWFCDQHRNRNNILDGHSLAITDSIWAAAAASTTPEEEVASIALAGFLGTSFLSRADKADSSCGSVRWLDPFISLSGRQMELDRAAEGTC